MTRQVPIVELDVGFEPARAAAVKQFDRPNRSTDQLAREVEQEVLPLLELLIAKLAEDDVGDASFDSTRRLLNRYLRSRKLAWTTFCRAIRTSDRGTLASHLQQWKTSSELAQGLEQIQIGLAQQPEPAPTKAWSTTVWRAVTASPVTISIVCVNLLVFAVLALAGVDLWFPGPDVMLTWGANHGPETLHGEPWRLLTCLFLHFGLLHVAFNMYVLSSVGRTLEQALGWVSFATLYLGAGLAGSVASLAWEPRSVSAGASGAVFGVVGAVLGMVLARRDLSMLTGLAQLRNSLLTFVGVNLAIGLSMPFVDNAAHLGGLGFGLVAGAGLSRVDQSKRLRVGYVFAGLLLLTTALISNRIDEWLRSTHPKVAEALARAEKVETAAGKRHDELLETYQQRELDRWSYARQLEQDLLPHWVALESELGQFRREDFASDSDFEDFQAFRRYLVVRRNCWELIVHGLREDPSGQYVHEVQTRWREADQLQESLRSW